MSDAKILFVDDEPNVLSAIKRALRNEFDIVTAPGAKEALALVDEGSRFGVVVSDYRMPEMDGIALLGEIGKRSPLSTRLMLTGNTDQETAVRAANSGHIFRFLNKPCDPDELKRILQQAIRQHELVTAEKELLEKTLKGSILVLADLLGIVKPEAFGRTSRLRRKARELAKHVDGVRLWELDAATMLSQLGCVNVAQRTLDKLSSAEPLSKEEQSEFDAHPLLGAELIGRIPRMQRVARIILYQHKHFDGRGFPVDDCKGQSIPLEARILHVVLAFDELSAQHWSAAAILEKLGEIKGRFDPDVVAALRVSVDASEGGSVARVLPSALELGMVVEEDVKNSQGVMLLCRGQEVTTAIREHLQKFERMGLLAKPILVSSGGGASKKAVA